MLDGEALRWDARRQVFVPYTNNKVFIPHPPGVKGDNRVSREVVEWMEEQGMRIQPTGPFILRVRNGAWFGFPTQTMAMLFKLTWGGR